eukprot:2933947-Rhodomonas_salina.3
MRLCASKRERLRACVEARGVQRGGVSECSCLQRVLALSAMSGADEAYGVLGKVYSCIETGEKLDMKQVEPAYRATRAVCEVRH